MGWENWAWEDRVKVRGPMKNAVKYWAMPPCWMLTSSWRLLPGSTTALTVALGYPFLMTDFTAAQYASDGVEATMAALVAPHEERTPLPGLLGRYVAPASAAAS